MPRASSQTAARVGLREIAAAADVSVMAVSLALRDNPRISAATRERIKRVARELGYRPDPELSRLMNHLRASRLACGNLGLVLVDFYPKPAYPDTDYNLVLRAGAMRRAAELGFSVTPMHLAEYDGHLPHLLDVLRTRGIEGVMLLPSLVPMEADPAANWEGLSVVAMSKSILAPRFHCVVPNHFGNMMTLFETLRAHGCTRTCAVFDELFDERTAHNFTAAVNWHRQEALMLIVPQGLSREQRAELVTDWIARQRPDVVFVQSNAVMAAVPRLKRLRPRWELQLVGLGPHSCPGFSHVDERIEIIGAAGIDLLAGMMYYHETGIPPHPRTTLIDGQIVLTRRVGAQPVGAR